MQREFYHAEQANADALTQQIEAAIPDAKISNLGWLVLVRLPNKSIFTLTPLTNETCDLSGTDCRDQKHEFNGVSWDEAERFLTNVETGAIQETMRTDHPFGEDALGANERNPQEKSRSEGKRKSAIAHNFENGSPLALENAATQSPEIISYLAEMLPTDNAEILGGELVLEIDCVRIVVNQASPETLSVTSFVDGEQVQSASGKISEMTKWLFQICDGIQTKAAERDKAEIEVEPSDIWETMHAFARETGQSDCILRNPSLFDLKQGLAVARPPFEQAKLNVVAESKTPAVQGAREHAGHPVSLNESRDASKPFADTLGGKVLRWVPGVGCVLVDKKDVPKEKFLSWNPDTAQVELIEGRENVKRPSWKPRNVIGKFKTQ